MPSKSLRQKICDIESLISKSSYWIEMYKLNNCNDENIGSILYNIHRDIEEKLRYLDMDYELYMILKRFYEYHMREINYLKEISGAE